MATPTLTRHRLPGALGELLVDVRAAGRSAARPAVVIVHGFKGFKDWGMFPPFAERLARAGFVAVSFNLSGSGVDDAGDFVFPERFGRNTFSAEVADLAAVVGALRSGALGVPAPPRLGLLGHSRGGADCVLYAAGEPAVDALVTWAAVASVDRWDRATKDAWRKRGVLEVMNARTGQILPLRTDILDDNDRNAAALDIPAAAARVRAPWLIVHGSADESVDVREGRLLASAAAPERSELMLVEGGGHTFGAVHPWRGSTPELDRVFDASAHWFGRWLA